MFKLRHFRLTNLHHKHLAKGYKSCCNTYFIVALNLKIEKNRQFRLLDKNKKQNLLALIKGSPQEWTFVRTSSWESWELLFWIDHIIQIALGEPQKEKGVSEFMFIILHSGKNCFVFTSNVIFKTIFVLFFYNADFVPNKIGFWASLFSRPTYLGNGFY